MPVCTRIHRGAVEIYYTCLICFWRAIVFLRGPYRFTGFWCIWHHHEILACSDIKNCMREAMEIADKKEDEIVFLWYWKHGTAEGSFTAKKWFGHRAGRSPWGHQAAGLDREDAMNLLVDVAECRWSKDADPLSSNVCGHAQNRLWARQYWRSDMCLRPFRARIFSKWLSVGYR